MDLESLLKSAGKGITYAWKWAWNELDDFTIVQKDSSGDYIPPRGYHHVQEVGEVEDVTVSAIYHDTLEVMRCGLTDLKYGEGRDVNAVHLIREERLPNDCRRVVYQPLRLVGHSF